MKKLKASEITKPGTYWSHFKGQLHSEEPILISRKGGTDLYIKYFGSSTDHKLNLKLRDHYLFSKAEPPKVCRWTRVKEGHELFQPGCRKEKLIPDHNIFYRDDYNFCQFCAGDIEVKEE